MNGENNLKIYITRHGETEWNIEKRMQGWNNSALTAKGIEESKKLGKRLKDIDFQCIYSSSLKRAVDTSKYIRGNKNTKIVLFDEFREMGLGKWEGLEHNKIEELYKEEYFNYWNNPCLYNNKSGESFYELFKRVESILSIIIKKHKDGNILIVSHGVVIKAIYRIVNGESLKDLWKPPDIGNTSLTIIEVKEGKKKIILESDSLHLKEEK